MKKCIGDSGDVVVDWCSECDICCRWGRVAAFEGGWVEGGGLASEEDV